MLFGSTAFDSFQDSTAWVQLHPGGTSTSAYLLDNLALLGFCAGVGLIFAVGTHGHRRADPSSAAGSCPNLFAHSVVPIIVGYIVAHYLSYFVEVGQQTLI